MLTRWLDRRIARVGPYLALCLSESEFRKAIAHLKAPEIPAWIKSRTANATMHTFINEDGKTCCVVCLGDGWQGRNPIEVAGLLVHEAVHVWQTYSTTSERPFLATSRKPMRSSLSRRN